MMCPPVKQDLLVSRMTRVSLTLTSIKQQQPQHDQVIFHGPVFQVADTENKWRIADDRTRGVGDCGSELQPSLEIPLVKCK